MRYESSFGNGEEEIEMIIEFNELRERYENNDVAIKTKYLGKY